MSSSDLPSTLDVTNVEPTDAPASEPGERWWRVSLGDGDIVGSVDVYMSEAQAAEVDAQKDSHAWIAEQVLASVRDIPGVNSQLRVLRQKSPLRLEWSG